MLVCIHNWPDHLGWTMTRGFRFSSKIVPKLMYGTTWISKLYSMRQNHAASSLLRYDRSDLVCLWHHRTMPLCATGCQKFVLGTANRLSAKKWNLFPLFVYWVHKTQYPLQQASNALTFPACPSKLPARTTISQSLLMRTRMRNLPLN